MEMTLMATFWEALTAATSRRGVLAGLGGLLAASPLARSNDAVARKRGKRRKKKRKHKKDPKLQTRVDATCPGPTDDHGLSSLTGDVRFAQTFTAQASGQLVRAELQLLHFSLGDYILQVGTVDAFGVPTNEVLAVTSVASAEVPEGDEVTARFNFGSPAELKAGTQYALVLTRPGSDTLIWRGHFDDTCAGRAFFSGDQTSPFVGESIELDLIYATFVQS